MEPQYAGQYRELYERHWWWRARERILVSLLQALFPASRELRILDVGCGDGLFFAELERFGSVEGVEPDAGLLGKDGPRDARIFRGSLEELPGSRKYDLVLMLDVIEHIEHEQPLLEAARERLSEKGYLLVTVPAFMALWTHHDELNRHYRRYTKDQLRRTIESAGLAVERLEYVFVWPAIVKLVGHHLEKWWPNKGRTAHIPTHWVNRTLAGISRAEYAVTSWIGAPFGSSAIAVARRCTGSGQRKPEGDRE